MGSAIGGEIDFVKVTPQKNFFEQFGLLEPFFSEGIMFVVGVSVADDRDLHAYSLANEGHFGLFCFRESL